MFPHFNTTYGIFGIFEGVKILPSTVFYGYGSVSKSIILTLFTVTIVALWTIYSSIIKKNPRVKKYLNMFPGPPTVPLFGNALIMLGAPTYMYLHLATEITVKYGSVFRFWVGNRGCIGFNTGRAAEQLLSSKIHIDKTEDYDFLRSWLGNGLLTAPGDRWFARRKLLTPAFHFKILDEFMNIFNEQSSVLVNIFNSQCAHGEQFNIYPYLTRCTLDIISETAMGKNVQSQTNTNDVYINAVNEINDIITYRAPRPWLRLNFLWNLSPQGRAEKRCLKILHKFTEDVITERKKTRKNKLTEGSIQDKNDDNNEIYFGQKRKRLAFLDLLLDVCEDGKVLSDLDIREEVDTFMFEGHDTTSASLNWAAFLLACNPQHQKRVQDELDEIFGDDYNRPVTSKDITKMKYLECCIKEALRLYPSSPLFGRTLKQDCIIENNMLVPAGTVVYIISYLLHRDPNVFPDPEKFDPERFTAENCTGRHPYAYLPFSAGPRNCIGQRFALMEEKTILAHIFRTFSLEAAERREDVLLLPEIILRPLNGFSIKMTKRRL